MSIAIAGFIQSFLILVLARFFEFIYKPYYSIGLLLLCQAISYFAIYFRPKDRKIPKYFEVIFFLQFIIYQLYSYLPTTLVVALFVVSLVVSIIYLNLRIIELLSVSKEILAQYRLELLGAGIGVVAWVLLFDSLGPRFSFALIAILSLSITSKGRYIRLLGGIVFIICLLPIENKMPLINKNQAFISYYNSTIEKRIWDVNATVDLLGIIKERKKVFLFDGGEIKSQIPNAEFIDWSNEKNKILNGKTEHVSGYELVVPYIKSNSEIKSAYLISCVGGQELYLAKAFGVPRKVVSDINLSALKISINELKNINGGIFSDVQIVHQDGRRYLENNATQFDLIQIYNAHAASHYGLIGKGTQPTTLMTAESLRTYYRALSENGILHIGTFENKNLYSLIEAYINEQLEVFEENILILKRKNNTSEANNISIFLSKKKWTEEDLFRIKSILQTDIENNYSINIFSKNTNTESEKYSTVTDDRPFYHFELIDKTQKIYLFGFFGILALLGLTYALKHKFFSAAQIHIKQEMSFNLILGIAFALNQLFIIYSVQKFIGLPGQGLALGLVLGLGASVLSLSLPKHFFWKIVISLALSICSIGVIFNLPMEFWKIVLGLLCQTIINRTYISRLLNGNVALNSIYAINGIGYCLGAALFYVVWLHLGLSYVYIVFLLIVTLLVIDKRFRVNSHSDN